MGFMAVAAAAPQAVKVGSNILSGVQGLFSKGKDQARAAEVQAIYDRAARGDVAAYNQLNGILTERQPNGRFQWTTLHRELAQKALNALNNDGGFTARGPSSPLSDELGRIVTNVRADVAEGVARIGSGATAAAANAVAGDNKGARVSVLPLTQAQLVTLLGAGFLVVLVMRSRK